MSEASEWAIPPAQPGEVAGDRVVSFRVAMDVFRRVEAVCLQTGRPRADVLRRLLEKGLQCHEAASKR